MDMISCHIQSPPVNVTWRLVIVHHLHLLSDICCQYVTFIHPVSFLPFRFFLFSCLFQSIMFTCHVICHLRVIPMFRFVHWLFSHCTCSLFISSHPSHQSALIGIYHVNEHQAQTNKQVARLYLVYVSCMIFFSFARTLPVCRVCGVRVLLWWYWCSLLLLLFSCG